MEITKIPRSRIATRLNTAIAPVLTFAILAALITALVRWSDYPLLLDVFPLNFIFLRGKHEIVDDAALSIISGLTTGCIVFMATTYLPSLIRNQSICNTVYKELQMFVYVSNHLLLSMHREASTDRAFFKTLKDTDNETLEDAEVLRSIATLNLQATAHTLLFKKENPTMKLTWAELICCQFEQMHSDIEKTALLYHSYLSNYELKLIEDILTNHLICMITGKDNNIGIDVKGEDGNDYFLYKIDLPTLLASNKRPSYSLAEMTRGNNALLADYIQLLAQVSKYLEIKLPEFNMQFAITKIGLNYHGNVSPAAEKLS